MNKEFFVFLFFLAMSAGFWLMITLNETEDHEFTVPLKITGVPGNVVITDSLPSTIKVTLRDKGYNLVGYMLGDGLQTVTVDFNTYANSDSRGTVPLADLQKTVRTMLYGSTQVVSVKADKLDFYFNFGLSKLALVVIDGQIRPADTYYLARMGKSQDTIRIYAKKSILDSIRTVYTEHINLIGFTDTITRTLRLKRIPGVKMVPDHIKVTFYPDILTEKIISVPITSINMPEGLILRTFPNQANVKVVLGRGKLNTINPSDFRVVVDYNDVASQPSDKCNLILQTVSKDAASAKLETQQVDYLIENTK